MKPPPFDYYDPTTLREALDLLRQHGEEGKILAGGQSLVPLLNLRLTRPRTIIDVNKVRELDYIREADGGLAIGALTRDRALETSPLVAQRSPLLVEAAHWVGHLQIRNLGTFGGSLAHADPAAEFPAVVAALGGTLVMQGPAGTRMLTPAEFFLTYLTTTLEPT
ncbi:MAG: FAD binding domain-containing protein, partial [Deltaproteobacteria bacterium]|nr:FAD binding domain-containing protein [Deltaproteobacteria bacterium]